MTICIDRKGRPCTGTNLIFISLNRMHALYFFSALTFHVLFKGALYKSNPGISLN